MRETYIIISLLLLCKINLNHAIDTEIKRLNISKCCPTNHYVHGMVKICRRLKHHRNAITDLLNLPLYTSETSFFGVPKKTGRVLHDVYDIEPGRGKLADQAFHMSAFDYSIVKHNFYVTEVGILLQEVPNEFTRWHIINSSSFCVDFRMRRNVTIPPEVRFWTVLNIKEKPTVDDPFITSGLLISCVFLFLVLVVYGVLPELRNLVGMVLMAYVGSLLGAFLFLAIIQIKQHLPEICLGLTYFTYFFFLASFCWMNIMSCDIFWTFRGYAKLRPIHRRGEKFKFVMYCAYAWGLPLAMTIMFAVLNHIDLSHIPWLVKPGLLARGCFIGDEAKLLYLYIPMLFLIMQNWVFFLLTAFNVWRLHRETAMLNADAAGTPAAHRLQRNRLMIYLRLSVIMGVNWVLEVISSFYPEYKIWIITDAYNLLMGVAIFLIFVCKKKTYKSLKKRFRSFNWLTCSDRKEAWNSRYLDSNSSRSQTSNTSYSEVSQDAGPPICPNPKGLANK